MLAEIFPRYHARYESLPILGPHLNGFVTWLHTQGYPLIRIRLRLRAAKRLDALLHQRGVRQLEGLSAATLLGYLPADSKDDVNLAAAIRSLVRYLDDRGVLEQTPATPIETLVAGYRRYLKSVRGLADGTIKNHTATVSRLLAFLKYNRHPDLLGELDYSSIEAFIKVMGTRRGRTNMQHVVAHLRSFLRFLTARGMVPPDLDIIIDTPRVYRSERPPRAIPWETTRALLRAIDRSTTMGRRDYAMLLLVATYGLRSCEVVAITLDDIEWRAGRLRVSRPKVRTPLLLPLTSEVEVALLDYLQHGRPELRYREIFLRVRAPAGTLKPTALSEVFQGWVRRSGLPIPFQGPHCLRHSLAVHLLRQGTTLKAIGDLLGHRSAESTCVYLQLHVEDLRDVALNLPDEVCKEVHR